MTRTEFIMDYLSPARNRGGHSGWWESVEREIAALETDLMQHAAEAERLRTYAEAQQSLVNAGVRYFRAQMALDESEQSDNEDAAVYQALLDETVTSWLALSALFGPLAKNPNPAGHAVSVPEGWKLVPAEPTDAMVQALIDGIYDSRDSREALTSAIAAAPHYEFVAGKKSLLRDPVTSQPSDAPLGGIVNKPAGMA